MLDKTIFSKKEFIFLVAFIVFIVALILDRTMWANESETFSTLMKLMRYAAYGMSIVAIFFELYKKNILWAIATIGIVCAASFLGSSNITMFLYAFIFIAAYAVDANKIIKVSFFTQAILLFSIVIFSQIGIIQDFIFTMDNRPRHALGFSWTTTSAILFAYLVFQYNCIRREKISYVEILVLEIVNYFFYKMTDSRMAFYLTTLFLLFICVVKFFGFQWKISRFFKDLICFLPTIIAICAIGIHAIYNPENKLMSKLNSLLSGRLRLGKQGIEDYGFTLLGQPIEWIGYSADQAAKTVKYNYVDCSYLQILLEYGIIFLILVLAIYTVILYKAVKKENYFMVWSIIFVLVFSITEPRLMNLSFNPFPVLVLANIGEDIKEWIIYKRKREIV